MKQIDQKITAIGIFIWAIAATFFLYEFFLRTFVGSIAHQIIQELHLSVEQFTFLGSAYYLAYCLMQIPVGILADRFGVKKIMIFSTLTCALATLFFALSHNFALALCGRFLMGIGSSFAFVCLLVIVSNWFPKRFFGFFAGLSQFVGAMGPMIAGGPLVFWLISSHVSWRFALISVGALGVVLAILSLLFVKDKPRGRQGSLLLLSKNELILARFKSLLKIKQVWVVGIYSASIYVSISVMSALWGTSYLEAVGLSQTSSAYMISIAWVAYAIGCPVFGFLSDITKRRKPFLIICAVLGLVSTSLILYGGFASSAAYEVLFFTLGLAATGQNIGFAAITEHASPDSRASALGFNNGLIFLLIVVVPLVISYLICLSNGSSNAQNLPMHSFIFGLSVLPIVYFIALVISCFFFKETYCRPRQ